jgi:tRNA pseudouridine55 synthase
MDGYLLINKPKEWTSFDVVNKIRHIVQNSGLNDSNKKRFPVGHTGTLDPLATGLLVILLGDYTKRATELTKLDKTYEVTMRLGQTSFTGDEEGEKTQVSDKEPTKDEVESAIKSFEGEIKQIPPAFSAIKVNGKKAYELARKGKEVKLEPRSVNIYQITDVEYTYPEIKFTAKVSSGTYIRSLVEDIGKKLETGAYMSDLKRTKVGEFDIKDATPMENINAEEIYKNLQTLD